MKKTLIASIISFVLGIVGALIGKDLTAAQKPAEDVAGAAVDAAEKALEKKK